MSKMRRRRRMRPMTKIKCIAVALLLLLAGALWIIQVQLTPIVHVVAAQKAHLEVIRLINETVYDQLGRGVEYEDLVDIRTKADGEVTLIQADNITISRLATEIAQELEDKIGGLGTRGVDVPLGLLTGYTLIADRGPNIHLDIQPMGEVSVDVQDEFIEAGINQTKHRIVLAVNVKLGIMIPFNRQIVEIQNSLPLVENIIVGPIPETYFRLDELGGLLGTGSSSSGK